MEKGVLLEVQEEYLIVMTKDGSFKKAVKEMMHYEIGDTVRVIPYVKNNVVELSFRKRVHVGLVTAATFVLLFAQLFLLQNSNEVYAYMSIDINPSMELSINDNMKVVDIETFNHDAEIVVQKLTDWKNKDVKLVTNDIIEICEQEGYLTSKKVVLTTTIVKSNDSSNEHLEKAIAEITIDAESEKFVMVTSQEASVEEREMSEKLNVSVGNYLKEQKETNKIINEAVPKKKKEVETIKINETETVKEKPLNKTVEPVEEIKKAAQKKTNVNESVQLEKSLPENEVKESKQVETEESLSLEMPKEVKKVVPKGEVKIEVKNPHQKNKKSTEKINQTVEKVNEKLPVKPPIKVDIEDKKVNIDVNIEEEKPLLDIDVDLNKGNEGIGVQTPILDVKLNKDNHSSSEEKQEEEEEKTDSKVEKILEKVLSPLDLLN